MPATMLDTLPRLQELPQRDRHLYEDFVGRLVQLLRADRAMVLLWRPEDHDGTPLASHAIEWSLPSLLNVNISTTLLARAYEERSVLQRDLRSAPGYGSCVSQMASGARSVLIVRLQNQPVLFYADRQESNQQPFQHQELTQAFDLARELERILKGEEPPPAVRPEPIIAPALAPIRLGLQAVTRKPRSDSLILFYRSFATMFPAGIGVITILEALGKQAATDDPGMTAVCERLRLAIETGSTLAAAMSSVPGGVFTAETCCLIKVGEESGALDHVLRRLADLAESRRRLHYRLRSSLAYPACAMTVGLILFLVTPWLLRSHLQMLAESGQALPWPTRVALLASSKLSWVCLGALAIAAAATLRRTWRDPEARLRLYRQLLRLPGVGRILVLASAARFCHTLGVLLEAGIRLSSALPMAVQSTRSPVLHSRLPAAIDALMHGGDGSDYILAHCLSQLELPKDLVAVAATAEEAGGLPKILHWLSHQYEADLERAMDASASLAEPLVMLVLGLLVTFVLMALFLPMMELLRSL